jgi:peptidyl-tRNA hydrolase
VCAVDLHTLENDTVAAFQEIATLKPVKVYRGFLHLKEALGHIPGYAQDCAACSDDASSFWAWVQLFRDMTTAKATIKANAESNILKLTNDLRKLRSDLKSEEYFAAGEQAGKMLAIVTVPLPPTPTEV